MDVHSPGDIATLDVGDRAPAFVLRRTFDEWLALADLIEGGPVVLAFYVFDFGHV
jgi:peroxiredoxin